ncbi:hypothetical protein ABFX02_10G015100 [Erythranthe guttata]
MLYRRIIHRTHHQNHGHVENDESWHPLPEKIYKSLNNITRNLRFPLPFYLWNRIFGKTGSHFDSNSALFVPNEKKDVITSTIRWTTGCFAYRFVLRDWSIEAMKLYGVPYWGFVVWLDLLTYLHHHDHEDKLPWYRGKTRAAKPVLGKYYRDPKKSGPLPIYLVTDFVRSLKRDHYVSDNGGEM